MPRPKKPRPWTLTGVAALLVYGEPADRSTPFHRPAWTRLDAHDFTPRVGIYSLQVSSD